MSIRIEIHATAGGADAETFAGELADAVSRHAGVTVAREGRVFVLHRL
ncbi:hypothetical protein [Actinoplanes xinjiangensis]|jgi:protein subunit release factor A|uniref:Uncharacterized protein n=1 Tax=Actinoplanes xinjiangensis TaxID=512350 RepID=A0A316FF30_9ACTN|nr:hypothetical protein [Actinoplanes xinjiangensis]PWK46943.1 hypothetical protein BC793_10857 [Actinoplanes xinjiangensis]GIF40102.1 hypothetical protein Axi01nite_44130 [Actinoplanes xinjiangensis]